MRALAIAILSLVVALTACDPAEPTPTPTAATPVATAGAATPVAGSPATSTVFTSQRSAFSIQLPAGWRSRNPEPLPQGDRGVDIFESPDGANTMYVSSSGEPLEPGTTPAEAMETVRLPFQDCSEVESPRETELGGEPAIMTGYECVEGRHYVLAVVAVHDDIGYLVFWDSATGNAEPDRRLFEEVLSTLSFTG